jgi:preprotein translocase subunit SecG
MSNSTVWFLGSVFSVVVSGLFWMLARRAEDRGLARATAVAVVVFCVAAIYFGSRL